MKLIRIHITLPVTLKAELDAERKRGTSTAGLIRHLLEQHFKGKKAAKLRKEDQMGMLYKRGEVFWIKYYSGGKPIRESTGRSKQKQAERFLKDREGRVAIGAPALPRLERIRFAEIADALIEHNRVTGDRQLRDVHVKLKPVRACFNHQRLVSIDQASLTAYIATRQAAGLSNGTINRELALLGKPCCWLKSAEKCSAFHAYISYRKLPRDPVSSSEATLSGCGNI